MLKRLELDVRKPYEPSIVDLSLILSRLDGVDGIRIFNIEMDQNVQNVRVIIGGTNLNYKEIYIFLTSKKTS